LDYVSDEETMSKTEYKLEGDVDSENVLKATSMSSYLENIGYLHTTALSNLIPTSNYLYRIGDGDINWSDWMSFATGPFDRPNFQRRGDTSSSGGHAVAAVYADLGLFNGLSTSRLLNESRQGIYDYAIHIGDIAYDLFSDSSSVGNEYMNLMTPMGQKHPLMVGEGNHEKGDNFTEYNMRFKAIESLAGANCGSNSNHFYSFDEGLVHYIMVSTEVYVYPDQAANGPSPFTAEQQLAWLEADLKAANAEGRREAVPWIVLMGHRPWYTADEASFRDFDALACQYGVDLYITGHVHNYQRWLPMRVSNPFVPAEVDSECVSADSHHYVNPKYMATIVAGSAGCHSPVPRVACPVMNVASELFLKGSLADCSAAYGFGHLQAVNATHLYWEFVQSHKAASIRGPEESSRVKKEESSVMEWEPFSISEDSLESIMEFFRPHLADKHIKEKDFTGALEVSAANWLRDELRRDDEVKRNIEKEDGGVSTGGSRLIRDYLWIEQHNRGLRDYC
jgi:acid phosphatase type 7